MQRQLLGEQDDQRLLEEVKAEVHTAVDTVLAKQPQHPGDLFDHVYATPTPQLEHQRAALLRELTQA